MLKIRKQCRQRRRTELDQQFGREVPRDDIAGIEIFDDRPGHIHATDRLQRTGGGIPHAFALVFKRCGKCGNGGQA